MAEKEMEDQNALDDWSTEQLLTLVERVEHYSSATGRRSLLRSRCTLAARKLDWQAIKFEEFSAEVCRLQWEHVMSKVGKIRTVKEILDGAAEWLKMPAQKRGHAGLPKKPLGPYMRFHKKQTEKLRQTNPSASLVEIAKLVSAKYKTLSEKRLARLTKKHQQEMAEYEEQLQQFYVTHPQLRPVQKPRRPPHLYADHKVQKALQQLDSDQQEDKAVAGELRKKYMAEWQNLSDKKKTRWIVKAVRQREKYLAANPNPKKSGPRFLSSREQELLEAHQGKPFRPPATVVRYFISAAPAAEGADCDLSLREYTARWKELPLQEQAEWWRGFYQVVTNYQAAMKEWLLSQQDADARSNLAAEEQKYNDSMAELFDDEEASCAERGYTIRGPHGLVEFERLRGDRLASKYPDEAAEPGGLRRLALEAYRNLSDDRRRKYEDAEAERLAKLGSASGNARKRRLPAGGAGAPKRKRKLLGKNAAADGVKLPQEPRKPPRSSYHTFLAQEIASSAGNGTAGAAPAQRKPLTLLNRLWAQLSKDEKEHWEERCKAEKQHYLARMEAYRKSLTAEQLVVYDARLAEQKASHRLQLAEAKKVRNAAKTAAESITEYFPPAGGGKPLGGGSGGVSSSYKAPRKPAHSGRAAPPAADGDKEASESGQDVEGHGAVDHFDFDDGGVIESESDANRAPAALLGTAKAAAAVAHRRPREAVSLRRLIGGDDDVALAVRPSPRKAGGHLSRGPASRGGGDGASAPPVPAASPRSPRRNHHSAAAAAEALASPPRSGPVAAAAAKSPRKPAVSGDGDRMAADDEQPTPADDFDDETEPDEPEEGAATTSSLVAPVPRLHAVSVAAATASPVAKKTPAVAGGTHKPVRAGGGKKTVAASHPGVIGLQRPKDLQKAQMSAIDS